MHRAFFRILAVALLILAIPVQGLAAVSAGMCMAMGGHDGHHSTSAHDHGDASVAHDHEHAASQDQQSNAHCPPCASCCATAAIAPTTGTVLPEAPLVAAIATAQYWIAGVLPRNLDRPPLAL